MEIMPSANILAFCSFLFFFAAAFWCIKNHDLAIMRQMCARGESEGEGERELEREQREARA